MNYDRDVGLIPESGRSPGEGNGNPLQCSCLGNPMDCSPPGSSVHGITKRTEQLSPEKHMQSMGEMLHDFQVILLGSDTGLVPSTMV